MTSYQKKLHPLFLLFIFLFLNACITPPPPPAAPVAIIPQVLDLKENEGVLEITPNTLVTVQNKRQEKIAKDFFNHFAELTTWRAPEVVIGKNGDIQFSQKDKLAKDGYELLSTNKTIQIHASNDAGFFYALQTLAQLLPPEFFSPEKQKHTRWVIPLVEIKDQPRFAWRGFMLDVSRHFYNKEYIKKVLDLMAALKLNTFHWHLTDDQGWRIEIKKYPKLTEVGAWRVDYNTHDENVSNWWGRPKQKEGDKADYGGFYTQDDIREIIAYAKERFITIIPEIDIPGHSQAFIASYPEIACTPGPYAVAT
ncbi:MAG TPA: beta-N-acetylhexosaminidase, partial [Saprospiraceae bacterium]|nr:beta-N-acetylhexosaminidase [Saprospiraceae bacterium]